MSRGYIGCERARFVFEVLIRLKCHINSSQSLLNLPPAFRILSHSRAGIELLRRKVEKTIPERVERAEITLSDIATLRAQIREERAKRQAADQEIYEDIVRRTAAMKRAMIAMASDGDSSRG